MQALRRDSGQAVLLGDPAHFEIRSGANPHTRDFWGRRKKVDGALASAQWTRFKAILESFGVRVFVVPSVSGLPGLVFPANAGFRFADKFYLSNLHAGRIDEKEHYRAILQKLFSSVEEFPARLRFEGEADFFPVGDPSGDPAKEVYLFTSGELEKQRWVFRFGIPPYRRVYGFRSDRAALPALQSIVGNRQIVPLELAEEAHYHGDTVLCAFGPRNEYLLAYLDALRPHSQAVLRRRFGGRLIPLSREDGEAFAANSFQIETSYCGRQEKMLLMPDGLTTAVYEEVRSRGIIPYPVDVSEFLEKGGGALKCMLLNLGELP